MGTCPPACAPGNLTAGVGGLCLFLSPSLQDMTAVQAMHVFSSRDGTWEPWKQSCPRGSKPRQLRHDSIFGMRIGWRQGSPVQVALGKGGQGISARSRRQRSGVIKGIPDLIHLHICRPTSACGIVHDRSHIQTTLRRQAATNGTLDSALEGPEPHLNVWIEDPIDIAK